MVLILPFLVILSLIVAVLSWWWLPRKQDGLLLLGLLLNLALVVEIFGVWPMYNGRNNNGAYNAFFTLQFVLITGMMAWPRQRRWPYAVMLAVGLLAMAVSFLLRGHMGVLWLEGILITSLLVIALTLEALWRMAHHLNGPLWKDPWYWLLLGMLLYHTGILPLVGLLDILGRSHQKLLSNLYVMVQVFAIVQYLFMAKACRTEYTRQRPVHEQ